MNIVFVAIHVSALAKGKLLHEHGYPAMEEYKYEKWEYFGKFVAQAIEHLNDDEDYHQHKCVSSYERISMMSFENIHKN